MNGIGRNTGVQDFEGQLRSCQWEIRPPSRSGLQVASRPPLAPAQQWQAAAAETGTDGVQSLRASGGGGGGGGGVCRGPLAVPVTVVPNQGECRLPFWVDLIFESALQENCALCGAFLASMMGKDARPRNPGRLDAACEHCPGPGPRKPGT